MVNHAGGATPVTVDQRINGGRWNSLGEFDLAPGQNHRVTLSAVAGTRSIADSVRFVPVVGGRIVQADAVKIVPNTAEDALYVHTDQLGTPRKLTDPSGAVVWDASLTPYGIEDSIAGTQTLDARFPGQSYDAESDLNYNYFRDYDPTLGRYLQSDPIGLRGGLNTYAYVGGRPVNYVDPKGLETTFIITEDYGIGSHAAVHVDNGLDGEPTLYDPAGSFVPEGSGRGSGDLFVGSEANIQTYMGYQTSTGSKVETYVFDTTPEEEAAIATAADEQGGAPPLFCAPAVSSAVSVVDRFSGISASIPGPPFGLRSQLRSLQKKSK